MAEKGRTSCERNLLNLIELGYEVVVHRARAEKTTQWLSNILKNLQNLQQVQQEMVSYLRDVVAQWSDAVITFSATARQWAAMVHGVTDICIEAGYKVEDIMTYVDALIDMMLGVPAVLKHEEVEEMPKEVKEEKPSE